MDTLYEQLRAIGAEIDNHYSDLYVRVTPETTKLVRASGLVHSTFWCERTSAAWFDIFGAYDPFWTRAKS